MPKKESTNARKLGGQRIPNTYEQRTKKGLRKMLKNVDFQGQTSSTTIREPIPFRDLHTWATILIIFYSCLSDFKNHGNWVMRFHIQEYNFK